MTAPATPHPPIPSVTFTPPSRPPDAVARPDLEGRLGPDVATRLSLVTGPAGSGKTTLARMWAATLSTPWTWMTVDATVGRSEQFWSTFVRAVQLALPDVVLDAVDGIGVDKVEGLAVAGSIADDLLRLEEPAAVIVIIDDAHRIDDDTWGELSWLINHQPPALHLVVVSRSDPPFPIARMRSLGHVTEVRQLDLAFSRDETDQLVRRHVSDVADEAVDALHGRTEGWVAGIRLALIPEAGSGRLDADDLTPLGRSAGFVSELLISEALEQLPDELRDFLTLTSVVSVPEPALCDALTDRTDSRRVLRRLARDHVFISALDDRPDVFRFHPLFAEVLRTELHGLGPPAESEQFLRGARWFADEGRYSDAIELALEGHHYETAFELIVGHLAELYRDGQRQAVGRWLLAIPDSFVCHDPDRAVELTGALMFLVRPEWLSWLARARTIVEDDRPDLLARLYRFEALSWAGRGDLDRFEERVAVADELRNRSTADPLDEVLDAWRARLLVLHGDAAGGLQIARSVHGRRRMLIQNAPALSLLGSVAAAAGDELAPELIAAAIAAWRAMGEPDLLGMADALTTGAQLALRRNQLATAEVLAGGAVAVSADRPIHLIGLRAELALAEVDRAMGRSDAADQRLAELRSALDLVPGLHPAVVALLDRVDGPGRRPLVAASPPPLHELLTERESLILRHLAGHRTYPEIGRELYISRHTVKTHVSSIYRKLGVSGRSEAVAAAAAHGLLSA